MYKRKFNEPSKQISIRVPESKYEYYKERWRDDLDGNIDISNNDKNNGEYQKLSNLIAEIEKCFDTVDNLIENLVDFLEDGGEITTDEYNNIIQFYDWDFFDSIADKVRKFKNSL